MSRLTRAGLQSLGATDVRLFTTAFAHSSAQRFGKQSDYFAKASASLDSLRQVGVRAGEVDVVCWPASLCADLQHNSSVGSFARLFRASSGRAQNWVVQVDVLKLHYLQMAHAVALRFVYFELDMLFVAHPARLLDSMGPRQVPCHLTLTLR